MNMTGDYLMAFVSVQKVGKPRGRDKCGEEHFFKYLLQLHQNTGQEVSLTIS